MNKASRNMQGVLDNRSPMDLALVALSGSAGSLFALSLSDVILPALGMNREPTNAKELAAQIGIHGGLALILGGIASQVDGIANTVLGMAAMGALILAGIDFYLGMQRLSLFDGNGNGNGGGGESGSTVFPNDRRRPQVHAPAETETETEPTSERGCGCEEPAPGPQRQITLPGGMAISS